MKDEGTARKVLSEQVRTELAHQLARAAAVIRHIDEKPPLMWALVAQETEEEARAAGEAAVEAKLLWYLRGVPEPGASATERALFG